MKGNMSIQLIRTVTFHDSEDPEELHPQQTGRGRAPRHNNVCVCTHTGSIFLQRCAGWRWQGTWQAAGLACGGWAGTPVEGKPVRVVKWDLHLCWKGSTWLPEMANVDLHRNAGFKDRMAFIQNNILKKLNIIFNDGQAYTLPLK